MKLNTVGMAAFDLDVSDSLLQASVGNTVHRLLSVHGLEQTQGCRGASDSAE